jgi:small subunit ribosomal protein S20
MAHNKSQEKRNRQTVVRTARNRSLRSELKTRARSAVSAARQGDETAAAEALRLAQKRIDQAAAKGVLKKNTAARRKRKLVRRVSEASQSSI